VILIGAHPEMHFPDERAQQSALSVQPRKHKNQQIKLIADT
jgi:hypothetical protein